MDFAGSMQVEAGGSTWWSQALLRWSHVRSHHSQLAVRVPYCYTCLSLSPPALDLYQYLWHMCSFLQPLCCHVASSCDGAACTWLQLLAMHSATYGSFLKGWDIALLLFLMGCVAPHEQPRLHGSLGSLLQGFKSPMSQTMLAMRWVQSRDNSPA